MVCDRCGAAVAAGEVREHEGKNLCEDCLMEALSPVLTCDPWAVHLAKGDKSRSGLHLTDLQQKLLDLVKVEGTISFPEAARRLELSEEGVRREFATLRHLELLRARKHRREILIALF